MRMKIPETPKSAKAATDKEKRKGGGGGGEKGESRRGRGIKDCKCVSLLVGENEGRK